MKKEEILRKVKSAGVVGAGGAGFPSYAKISADADVVIANGAECEPLLATDKFLMEKHAREIVEGLRLIKQTTGANELYIALKAKYKKAVASFNKILGTSSDIELYKLDNYYPAGDEFELVYDITGKSIPESGLPLDVGAVVTNVNTILNVKRAFTDDKPVTTRWVTVAGALETPYMAEVPVGITAGELIRAGKPKVEDYVIVGGGPMTGSIVDEDYLIDKRDGGILVLPEDNPAAVKKSRTIQSNEKRGKSMCDQCFDCSIVCPRNLLGHDLSPHKMMRNLFIAPENSSVHLTNAYLCCECGLCDMFACPLDLSPREMLVQARDTLQKEGVENPHNNKNLEVHPERDFRRVNTDRLVKRIGLDKYEGQKLAVKTVKTDKVKISLAQHIGAPSEPVISKGDKVSSGDIIAKIPEDTLGATVHASIDGKITNITDNSINIAGG
ncbi:MAG: 4Fe-4S dicluster domain-containing protein [Elusimicrobiota bacterium]